MVLSMAARYNAILSRDKKYDGVFYLGAKTTGTYCRPSCAGPCPLRKDCFTFNTIGEAELGGYQPCKLCHPDRLKNNISQEILDNIDAGAINDRGVHGLATSLHISDRHMRRIVHDRTGTSPVHLNQTKRLSVAKRLVLQTKLPIIEVAFSSEFSSLRQFNAAFRTAFNTSPREMRKSFLNEAEKPALLSALLLTLPYEKFLSQALLRH